MIDFGQTWNGYRYWMGMTPLTGSDLNVENPSILASADGTTWAVPAGLTNPVIPRELPGHGADTDLIMVGSTMWLLWLQVGATGTTDEVRACSSADGVTWSAPITLVSMAYTSGVAPAVVYDGTHYLMFTVNAPGGGGSFTNTIERRTAATLTGTWSAPIVCSATRPAGDDWWHCNVIRDGAVLYMIMSTFSSQSALYLGRSDDNGLSWSFGYSPILSRSGAGWDRTRLYRASILRTPTGFDLWYSALGGATWGIGRTTIGMTL